ncbi:MAG: PIN domain-containing protein [Propionibacteriaceae bacterium]|jgi:predicted nucleic-acid-binding protein|nr:PIN domain-containing protein [Propionibacteriaceae bacterium]
MPSADTTCLLRWLLDDVPAQTRRVQALLDSGPGLYVADGVLIETVFVLERQARVGRDTVALSIDAVLAEASFDVDRELWHGILELYRAHPKLAVADIYFALLARRQGRTPLYTFDRKMAAQLPDCAIPPEAG